MFLVEPETEIQYKQSQILNSSATSTLIFQDSLYLPLITLLCLSKTALSNSGLVSNQYAQDPPYLLRQMQSQSSDYSNNRMERAKANFLVWRQGLERTSAVRLLSLGNWRNVSIFYNRSELC
jgi:hypothetical protein